jgi:hypothetical protein
MTGHDYVGAHAERDQRRICPNHAAAEDEDIGRKHARDPTEQDSTATVLLFQVMRTDLSRHAARNLRHGDQKRKRPLRARHRFIGDGRNARGDQVLG